MSVQNSFNINDIGAIAENLKHLERIEFEKADLDDIMSFVKRARNLSKIKVNKFVRFPLNVKEVDKLIIFPVRIRDFKVGDTCPTSDDFPEKKFINISRFRDGPNLMPKRLHFMWKRACIWRRNGQWVKQTLNLFN